jgi:hypothetical protein
MLATREINHFWAQWAYADAKRTGIGHAFTGSSLTSTETISGLFLIDWDDRQETPSAVVPR